MQPFTYFFRKFMCNLLVKRFISLNAVYAIEILVLKLCNNYIILKCGN